MSLSCRFTGPSPFTDSRGIILGHNKTIYPTSINEEKPLGENVRKRATWVKRAWRLWATIDNFINHASGNHSL